MPAESSKISNTERDRVVIQREALLAKKRILDQIELLHEKGDGNKSEVRTKYGFLADAANVSEPLHFQNLLDGIMSDGAIIFEKSGRERGNWRYQEVVIKFNQQRSEYTRNIRDKYHELNQILQSDRGQETLSTTNNPPVNISRDENKPTHLADSKKIWLKITEHPVIAALIVFFIIFIIFKLTGIDLNNLKDSLQNPSSTKSNLDSLVQVKSPLENLPTVLITYPSFGSPVPRQIEATGSLKNIPTGSSLWLYVFSPRDNENRGAYYLDEITAINWDTSQWRIGKDRLYIGADKAKGYEYNLGVFVFDERSASKIRSMKGFNEIGFLKTDLPEHINCNCDPITVIRE